jgi:Flp pilus assembly protein TadG
MKTMENSHKGQTVIETALLILLLFVLFFGIAEVARFWWLKNQINNAARVAVRVAIVDTTLTAAQSNALAGTCSYSGGSCTASPSGNIQNAACSSITNADLCNGTTVRLTVTGVDSNGNPGGTNFIPGGIVKVTVARLGIPTIVQGLVPFSFGLIPVDPVTKTINLSSDSTMRHE